MKIVFVTLWLLTSQGQSTRLQDFPMGHDDPMKACTYTIIELQMQLLTKMSTASWKDGDLVCIPTFEQE